MASNISPTAPGGPAPLSELRVVLLGEAGPGKVQVASLLLGRKDLKEACELCFLHKSKHAGRKICVVDTPGWDRHSIHNTSENIKDEIVRSASLCPPGPHVLILVLPVANFTETPSADEFETVQEHMELLSERVWKHTMVLFLCNEEVEDTTVTKHIRNTKNLLEKCGNRLCVLQHADSETQAHALREKIEDTVRADDFFIPQIYYDMIQKKARQHEDTAIKGDKQQSEEQSEKTELRQRRGSLQEPNPNMSEAKRTSGSWKDAGEAVKQQIQTDFYSLPQNYLPPATVILFLIIGTLIGSVAGAAYGPLGSAVGIVIGFFISGIFSILLIYALKLTRGRTS